VPSGWVEPGSAKADERVDEVSSPCHPPCVSTVAAVSLPGSLKKVAVVTIGVKGMVSLFTSATNSVENGVAINLTF